MKRILIHVLLAPLAVAALLAVGLLLTDSPAKTLESLVIRKGLADADRLHALEHAWLAAAQRTPHGQPIELDEAGRALAD